MALVYYTYLRGSQLDQSFGIAIDVAGNAYIAGDSNSGNFPVTPDAFQATFGGGTSNAFMTKLNITGTAIIYATFLGRSNEDDGFGITVAGGNAYITGDTNSTNFSVTTGAFQTSLAGSFDVFVAKRRQLRLAVAFPCWNAHKTVTTPLPDGRGFSGHLVG